MDPNLLGRGLLFDGGTASNPPAARVVVGCHGGEGEVGRGRGAPRREWMMARVAAGVRQIVE